jgi:hypothetical protein
MIGKHTNCPILLIVPTSVNFHSFRGQCKLNCEYIKLGCQSFKDSLVMILHLNDTEQVVVVTSSRKMTHVSCNTMQLPNSIPNKNISPH